MQLLKRLLLSLLIIGLACPSFAALSSAVVFEVRNGGSDDSNGGGFKTGATGVDRSQQTAAHATLTTLSTVHTATTQINVSLTDHTVSNDDVGNLYNNTGGTSTAGLFEITAVDVGNNRWTLDRSIGTAGQTCAGNMGGCFATPGKAAAVATVSGHIIHWKYNATPFTVTTSTPGAGGPISLASTQVISLIGYDVTRGDDTGNRPTIAWGATSHGDGDTLVRFNGNIAQQIINIKVDGSDSVEAGGIQGSGNSNLLYNCVVVNCSDGSTGNAGYGAIWSSGGSYVKKCYFEDCKYGVQGAIVEDTTVVGASVAGIMLTTTPGIAERCLVRGGTGSADGIMVTVSGTKISHCTLNGNGGDGVDSQSLRCIIEDTVSTYNGGYAFRASATGVLRLINCADYTNTSGRTSSAPFTDIGAITLSGDPYVDRTGAFDFRPNNTAGAGAALRAAATGVYGQTNNSDVGALQHADPVGGAASDNGVIY